MGLFVETFFKDKTITQNYNIMQIAVTLAKFYFSFNNNFSNEIYKLKFDMLKHFQLLKLNIFHATAFKEN